jgi:hypothetical protein
MIAMRMVQASIDQKVDMVPVRNSLMTTAWSVPMLRVMSAGAMLRAAAIGICFGHFDHVLIDAPVVRMMEMSMVQVIDVVPMPNRSVATARRVDVRMIGRGHGFPFVAPKSPRQPMIP